MKEAIKRTEKQDGQEKEDGQEKQDGQDADRVRHPMDERWRDANDENASKIKSALTQMLISLDPWLKARQPFEDALQLEQPLTTWHKLQIPGFIVFFGLSCYLAGLYGYGYAIILLLLYSGQFVFSRRLQKFKQSLSAQIIKEEKKKKMAELTKIDHDFSESVEWINLIIARVWGVFEPTLSATIVEQVNLVLKENTPSFIQSISLAELTLGSEPPALVGAKAYPQTESDVIVKWANL